MLYAVIQVLIIPWITWISLDKIAHITFRLFTSIIPLKYDIKVSFQREEWMHLHKEKVK